MGLEQALAIDLAVAALCLDGQSCGSLASVLACSGPSPRKLTSVLDCSC